MLEGFVTSHAVQRAGEKIPRWRGWSEDRIRAEIIRRLPYSEIINRRDKIYSQLERGNVPCKDEMVCFMRDDVAVYVLKRKIPEKKFRVSTIYFVKEFTPQIISLGTYLNHKGYVDLTA